MIEPVPRLKFDKEQTEEKEIRERKEMARVLLFQSRSESSLEEGTKVESINFTNLLMVQKSEGVAAGKVMFVGGSIRPGEDIMGSGMRRCVGKTHLRPTRQSLAAVAEQDFIFLYPGKGGLVEHHNHYLAGRLLPEPMDQPYALDANQDRIEQFVWVDLDQFDKMLRTGNALDTQRRPVQLVDSLAPAREPNSEHSRLQRDLLFSFKVVEAKKKMDVLEKLYTKNIKPPLKEKLGYDNARYQAIIEDITAFNGVVALVDNKYSAEKERAISRVNSLWARYTKNITVHQIKQALHFSNYEAILNNVTETHLDQTGETVSSYNPETGEGIPTIDLVMPLLVKDKLDISELRILRSNPQAWKVLRMISTVNKKVKAAHGKGQEVGVEEVKRELREVGLVSIRGSFVELSKAVDDFFIGIYGLKDVEIVDQFDELKTYSSGVYDEQPPQLTLDSLWQYASGTKQNPRLAAMPESDDKKKQERVFRFEAQRKLVLMLLLNDALQIIEKSGGEDHVQTDRYLAPIKEIENVLAPSTEVNPIARTLKLRSAQTVGSVGEPVETLYSNVTRHQRTKTLESVLRKLIVRDQTFGTDIARRREIVKDVHAETYIFDQIEDDTVREYQVPLNPSTGTPYKLRDSKGRELKSFSAPAPVADLIISLLMQGSGAIEIEDYKPMPESGAPIKSKGPGGGAQLRYAKFYIKHITKLSAPKRADKKTKEKVRYREVHVFIPDLKAQVSGHEEFVKKDEDDKNYFINRLFSTHGLRSFMELLFPVEIYGDEIRKMYQARELSPPKFIRRDQINNKADKMF